MFERALSRRQFIRLAGAAGACALLKVTTATSFAVATAGVRSEWTFGESLPSSGVFETPVLHGESSFDAVDMSWLATARGDELVQFDLRVLNKAGAWSDWIRLHPDGHELDGEHGRQYIAPVLHGGQALQVRLTIDSDAGITAFTVGTIDTSSNVQPEGQSLQAPATGSIISRAGWGANELLRYEDQDPKKPLIWPPEYQPVQKIVIHHTATDNDPLDSAAAVRAIYYYHAVTREWGDIGYNYLIDTDGRVFEGRFGGANVIGGHALQYNRGSMGIAFLGNFDYAEPPDAMVAALARLVKERAPGVDVTTASDFQDLIALANLCGHQDVIQTSCPGSHLYPLLPVIRGRIAGTEPIHLPPPKVKERLDLLELNIGPDPVYQENLLEVRARVLNAGILPITSSGPDAGYIYTEGTDFDAAGFPKVASTYRLCVDFDGNEGTFNPYRWGLGEPIAPGEEREIVGYIRAKDVGERVYSGSVVKELIRYGTVGAFPTSIRTAEPPVNHVAALPDATVRYFSETGHNVPQVFNDVWEAQGGLRRFGYPLTEAFYELSETDGGLYLTQYFERARFEWHPEFAGTEYEVLFGLLGAEMTVERRAEAPFEAVAPFASSQDRVFVQETGHSLGGIFKDAWESRGGLPIFGYPISEEFEELSDTDGKMHVVQYFERNRFEHHPQFAGTEYEVLLGHLGREMLIRRGWLRRPFEDG